MELLELNAVKRKTTGNGPARALRRAGKIPAVLYGPDTDPLILTLDVNELELMLKKSNTIQVLLNLNIKNGKTVTKPVMIKEIQTHPVDQRFLHVDFYEVDMKRKIRVMVPVVTTGKSQGVELGGMLQIIRRELEVLCYPNQIPASVEIDISELDIGESVHVEDIPLDEQIEVPTDVNFTVLTILSPKKDAIEEEEEEELEEGEEEEVTEDESEAE